MRRWPAEISPDSGDLSFRAWQDTGPEFDHIPPSRLWTMKLLNDAVEYKDGYTMGHCHRVGDYAQTLGSALGLEGGRLRNLLIAASFHDIGKVGVLSGILNKPGPLDQAEWYVMYMHPLLGRELWESSLPTLAQVGAIIHGHHERWDGQGYPQGLGGTDVMIEGRILHVADAYDAMMSDRPYRPALGAAHTLRELREGAGSQFDPDIVGALTELIEDGRSLAA